MQLVDALAAGVRGAENGHAELYLRGTSIRATWYASFEGDGADSTGANISLDAYGGATVYVASLCDVVVKNSLGTTIREVVAGARDDTVEVVSPSFTGTDYDTAQIAANKPTTLAAVLDSWLTSAGGTNFNVNIGGQTVTIMQALAGNTVVNVKADPYNAEGDGVTDDTAAINAAVVYANALGGGTVYFPAGNYLISDTIGLLENVSLLGVSSANTSTITRATSDAAFVTTTDSSSFIRHLTFQDSDAGANEPYFELDVSDVLHLEYVVCLAPPTTTTAGSPIFNDDCGGVRLRYCQIQLQGTGGRLTERTGAALVRDTFMVGTSLTWTGDNNFSNIAILGIIKAYDSTFNYVTDGTAPVALIQPYETSVLVGNSFTITSATVTALSAYNLNSAAGAGTLNAIVEAGNQYEDEFGVTTAGTGSMLGYSQLLREKDYAVASGGSVTIDAEFGIANVVSSGGAGVCTLAFSTLFKNNGIIHLVFRNPTANNHTITTSGTSPVDAGVAVNAGQVARVIYSRRTVGGTTAWFRMTAFTVTAI